MLRNDAGNASMLLSIGNLVSDTNFPTDTHSPT